MGAPEMFSELYADHMSGDPAYDKAFVALADCPSFAQVERALKTYAHELAEKIRAVNPQPDGWTDVAFQYAADMIDPEKSCGYGCGCACHEADPSPCDDCSGGVQHDVQHP